MTLLLNPFTATYWIPVRDADPRVIALYRRHYSADRNKNHHTGIAGPSERMVMLTTDAKALWVWRLIRPPEERISVQARPDQRRARRGNPKPSTYFGDERGVMCSVFRNEGPVLSSILVREAMTLAWERWPGERLFTYVWDERVRSPNPGYCYKVVGWRYIGHNKDGRLSILEFKPEWAEQPGPSQR